MLEVFNAGFPAVTIGGEGVMNCILFTRNQSIGSICQNLLLEGKISSGIINTIAKRT